jgi:FYVE and coiled-coil domain-containing protein 1
MASDLTDKLISKQCLDLEQLTRCLIDIQNEKHEDLVLNQNEKMINDDCNELQKFCAKLEFLIQFKLKEKKSLLSSNNESAASFLSVSSKSEYWSFLLEVFKSSRSFEDAITYVKNLNEIKTNLGRGRAFIRFCLHFHRLADAIQQLTMDEKIINNWYSDKSVWFNQDIKSRLFQLLYDLNDVDFDLISKSNFELDTSWPICHSNKVKLMGRNRTASISSFASFINNNDSSNLINDNNTNNLSLLSSTPLEMEDNLSRLINSQNDEIDINQLRSQIESLTEQLNSKTKKNIDLNKCLKTQTNLSENLSELLKTSQSKNNQLENQIEKISTKLSSLQLENGF